MWRLSTPQIIFKAPNKCAAHFLNALQQANMGPVETVGVVQQENILSKAGVIVHRVLKARMDLWKAKVPVIFVLPGPSQTKPAKLQ
jgi:hypothetical protein